MQNIGGYEYSTINHYKKNSIDYSCDNNDSSIDENFHNFVSQTSFEYKDRFEIPIERSTYYTTEKPLLQIIDSEFSLDVPLVSYNQLNDSICKNNENIAFDGYDTETSNGSVIELNEVFCSSEDENSDFTSDKNQGTKDILKDGCVDLILQE